MKRLFLLTILLCGCSLLAAAAPDGKGKPQAIIFETDMCNDIDDAMALDLLFNNMYQDNIKLL